MKRIESISTGSPCGPRGLSHLLVIFLIVDANLFETLVAILTKGALTLHYDFFPIAGANLCKEIGCWDHASSVVSGSNEINSCNSPE